MFLQEGTGNIWNLQKYLKISMVPDITLGNLSMYHKTLILNFQTMILVRKK